MINYKYLLFLLFTLSNIASGLPAKKINLQPEFVENMMWKQRVKVVSIRTFNTNSVSQIIDLTMNVVVKELKDTKPKEIVCNNVTGWQSIVEVKEKIETKTDSLENKNGQIIATIDENYEFKNAKDHGKLSDDILMYFSPGPFIGFIPPSQKIKIGESWDSGTIVPVGPKTHSKKKLLFSEIKGAFTLTKIEKELAYILWEGKANVNENLAAKWKRTVIFDRKNNRFISSLGELQIDAPEWTIIHKVDVFAEY